MISYLAGKIIKKIEGFVILEVNGLGYEVLLAQKTFATLPQEGDSLTLFCQMEANERGVKLYGFATFEQMELFKIIRVIQGVGPKAALEISGLGSLETLRDKIEKNETDIFEALPNIGQKKAQKIVLELSGKIKQLNPKTKKDALENEEAFLGLIGLGFSKEQAKKALLALPANLASQEKIKQALMSLGR